MVFTNFRRNGLPCVSRNGSVVGVLFHPPHQTPTRTLENLTCCVLGGIFIY
jgi:hypothetical protein